MDRDKKEGDHSVSHQESEENSSMPAIPPGNTPEMRIEKKVEPLGDQKSEGTTETIGIP